MNYLDFSEKQSKQKPVLTPQQPPQQTWKSRLTILWGIFLWQASQALVAIPMNRSGQFSLWKIALFVILFAVCVWLSYRWAVKFKLIPKLVLPYFQLGKIGAGFGLMFLTSILSGLIMTLTHTEGTQNQATVEAIGNALSPLVFFIMATSAGFFEELLFRVSLFELLFNKWPKVATLLAWGLFTAAHGPTDFPSFIAYGSMSLVLTGLYAKYRNFYLNLSVHFLWNAFGIISFFLIK